MMAFVEIWGGGFYLLSKISFSQVERSNNEEQSRTWLIRAWSTYLIGLLAVLYFYGNMEKWMVVFVEAGGGPAMVVGLIRVLRGRKGIPRILEQLAIVSAVVGIGVSFWAHGIMAEQTQWYELGLSIGFLVGTVMLASNITEGYLFFMVMIISNLLLLYAEQKWFFFGQQILSMGFVIDAYRIARKKAYYAQRLADSL